MTEEYMNRMKKYDDMKKYCVETLYPKYGIKDLFSLTLDTFQLDIFPISQVFEPFFILNG